MRPKAAREKLGLDDGAIVVIDAAGLSERLLHGLLPQLSLALSSPLFLFDAGDDPVVADFLRRKVPGAGLRARMFGDTQDAPAFWRSADLVVGSPRPGTTMKALAAGLPMLLLEPEDAQETSNANALADRGLATVCEQVVLLSSSLEQVLRDPKRMAEACAGAERRASMAGLEFSAECILELANDRLAVVTESIRSARKQSSGQKQTQDQSARKTERDSRARAATVLEDLSDGGVRSSRGASVDRGGFDRLRKDLDDAQTRLQLELSRAREEATLWENRAEIAKKNGDVRLATEALREADRKRARMHRSLQELARIARGKESVANARPKEANMKAALRDLKLSAEKEAKSVETELAELKRRMKSEK